MGGRDSAENWAPMDDGTGPGGGRDDGGEGRRRESLPRSGGVEVSRVPVNVRTVESQTAIRRQHVLPGSYRVRCWWTMTQGRARAWTGLGCRFGGWRMAVVWSCCLRAHKERKLGAGDRAQFSSQSAILDIPPPPPPESDGAGHAVPPLPDVEGPNAAWCVLRDGLGICHCNDRIHDSRGDVYCRLQTA